MSNLNELKIGLDAVGHVLADTYLRVPTYQRPYAWEDRHIQDLILDVQAAITQGDQEYFLGSIVLIRGQGNLFEVVDGQQRLATTAILIAAMRDHLFANGDSDTATRIEERFLISVDRRTKRPTAKLELSEYDNEFFLSYVLTSPGARNLFPDARRESHRRIKRAAELTANYVREIAGRDEDISTVINDWLDYFEDKVKVIAVVVPDYTNAFTIFETLNDRGLALAISDLLKNHLFRLAEGRINEVQTMWTEMTSRLDASAQEDIVVTFIRHSWSSTFGLARERDLYQKIKERITSPTSAIPFANSLVNDAYIYAAILSTSHELWTEYTGSAHKSMETLNELGVIQMRPLILAVLDKFDKQDVERSLAFLVCVAVRFLVSGQSGSGAIESVYCETAVAVRSGAILGVDDMIRRMRDSVPRDADFRIAFSNASVTKSSVARVYLRALERTARGRSGMELVPNPDSAEVNLEHILPKRPSRDWFWIDEGTRSAYVDRIGNLALLTSQMNNKLKNGAFEKKVEVYSVSELLLTRMLAEEDYSSWGPDQIEDRQRQLSELAVMAWALE